MYRSVTSKTSSVISTVSTSMFSTKAVNNPFVTAAWLKENLSKVKVLDCSWKMGGGNACYEDFVKAHIPGAQFFDCDKIADLSKSKPHTLPSAEVFAAGVGEQGVTETDTIVVYDTTGLLGAARGWWTFTAFGAQEVYVLEGGIPFWLADGGKVESGPAAKVAATKFTTMFNKDMYVDMSTVVCSLGKDAVLDARSPGRFAGTEPEPRPGLLGGHMPGAKNVPYGSLFTAEKRGDYIGNVMKTDEELEQILKAAGITKKDSRIITSCGSGMTASTLYLALRKLGFTDVGLYDGSWTEYGNPDNKNKVATQ